MPLYLVSWNVASWPATIKNIKNGLKMTPEEYFMKLCADVICLQEVKVNKTRLENKPSECWPQMKNYESFWSCSSDPSSIGFQGVTTYAKNGLTIRAYPNPFGDDYLNSLGRCIVTEHEHFLLFNVYAPVGNPDHDDLRVVFFRALTKAMDKFRERVRKPIILCGDLNVRLTSLDSFYLNRRISLSNILEVLESKDIKERLDENLIVALRDFCAKFLFALSSCTAVDQVSRADNKGQRSSCNLSVPWDDGKLVFGRFDDMNGALESARNSIDTQTLLFAFLRAAFHRYMKIPLLDLKEFWKWLSDKHGVLVTEENVVSVLHKVMRQEEMIDAHRFCYPEMSFRFTCWRQDTNRRYENEGSRIDYFLMDKALAMSINRTEMPVCPCTKPHDNFVQSEEAGLCSATCGFNYEAAPFSGEGLRELSFDAIQKHFQKPCTWFIYTPPRFSDHCAVSLLLDLETKNVPLDESCSATKNSQLFKRQKTIDAFFKRKGTGGVLEGQKKSRPDKQEEKPTEPIVIEIDQE